MCYPQQIVKDKITSREESWQGKCSASCWNATQSRCTCKCNGKHHGRGVAIREAEKIRCKPLDKFMLSGIREKKPTPFTR